MEGITKPDKVKHNRDSLECIWSEFMSIRLNGIAKHDKVEQNRHFLMQIWLTLVSIALKDKAKPDKRERKSLSVDPFRLRIEPKRVNFQCWSINFEVRQFMQESSKWFFMLFEKSRCLGFPEALFQDNYRSQSQSCHWRKFYLKWITN